MAQQPVCRSIEMNNRVRELIKEHGSDSSGKWVAVDKVHFIAELIVEECLDILEDEDDGEIQGKSARIAALRIKKLFGVE